MGRKVFQDFAHVLCQKFVEVPSNRDLVNLVIFGDGTLELDLLARKAMHNRAPVEPLPYVDHVRVWLDQRLAELRIDSSELISAALTVEYTVALSRLDLPGQTAPLPGLSAAFDFACTGTIESADRKYTSTLKARKRWSLGSV